MPLYRRQLLKYAACGAALPALSLIPRLAQGSSLPTITDRYFVFAYFSGGWDGLLALDPKDPDQFRPDNIDTTGIEVGYANLRGVEEGELLLESGVGGMTFGPYIGDLLPHASKLAVLRGMSMDSVAHLSARRHILTGLLPAGTSVRGSSLGTMMAYLLGENEPIPNLVAGLSTFNVGHPLWAAGLPTSSIDDLYSALSPSDYPLLEGQRAAIEEFFAKEESRIHTSLQADIYGNRRIARSLIEKDIAEYFDLDAGTSEMLDLREIFGIDSGVTGKGGEMALMAAQALTKGISRCVTIKVADGLDSHQGADWQNNHGPSQREGFDSIAALMNHLENTPYGDNGEDNWLNHTTICCFSEFGRGAELNSNGGRDHSLTNAMLMMGAGIQGGRVIGASSDIGMQPQAIDLTSGQVDTSGEQVTNNHVARTLLHSIGITDDIGDFRKDPILALLSEAE
ncbi:MAG: DUF1501 domain-containing protein [Myxococcota bacterium]